MIDSYTKLLLNYGGVQGSTVFTDSSLNDRTVSITGTVVIDQVVQKFGTGSGSFGGAGHLTVVDSTDWFFDTGNLTIDTFVRYSTFTDHAFWAQQVDTSNFVLFRLTGSIIQFVAKSGGTALANYTTTATWSPTVNTWYHLAVVRDTTSIYIFIDGVSQALTINTAVGANSIPNISSVGEIGGDALASGGGADKLNGNLDSTRVSKGIARWISNFTPPTDSEQLYKTLVGRTRPKAFVPGNSR